MAPEMLTVEEAAQRLKMNPQTLRRWIRSGLLSATRVGKKEYRISAADLENHIAQATPTQVAERTAAVEKLVALRGKLGGRGLSVTELLADSRRELEARGGAGGR